MKTITFTKEKMIQAIFVAGILLIASCGNNQQTRDTKDVSDNRNDNRRNDSKDVTDSRYNSRMNDTKDVAEERNDARFDNRNQENDAKFLVTAAENSLEQIQAGQLAQRNGSSADVKELGKMMVDAHTKSLNDLRALADRKSITIPTSVTDDSKDAYTKLNEKTGNDFDKAYTDRMVSAHKDVISTYEKASTDSYDTDIKNWAATALPGLRTHLEHSVDSQTKSKKITEARNN